VTIPLWPNHCTTWPTQPRNRKQNHSWTPDDHIAFEKLKALVNHCPKLYFIDYNLPVILYTNASDYAHGAHLCQIRTLHDGTSIEEPIRLLGGTYRPTGAMVHEKEAYAIYTGIFSSLTTWFIYDTNGPPQPTFPEQPWFQESVAVGERQTYPPMCSAG